MINQADLYRFDLKNKERLNLVNPPDLPYQGGKQLSEKPENSNPTSINKFRRRLIRRFIMFCLPKTAPFSCALLLGLAVFVLPRAVPAQKISVPEGYSAWVTLAEPGALHFRGSKRHVFDNPPNKHIRFPAGESCVIRAGDGLIVTSGRKFSLFRQISPGGTACPYATELYMNAEDWLDLQQEVKEIERARQQILSSVLSSPPVSSTPSGFDPARFP